MRAIKFRVWNPNANKFVAYAGVNEMPLHEAGAITLKVPVYEILQYTGLKDKNGVEIYEGDVLEYISPEPQDDDHTDRYVVEWRVKEFVGVWLKDRLFKNRDNDGLIDPHLDMLVIGNIYENPELLEEANQ